jgi:hypothetical protein
MIRAARSGRTTTSKVPPSLRSTVRRSLLDLDAGTLILEDTRVIVDGRAEDSDGKSAAGRRAIALDPYTVKHLVRYVAKIDDEAAAHGRPAAYEFLAVGPTGEKMHWLHIWLHTTCFTRAEALRRSA